MQDSEKRKCLLKNEYGQNYIHLQKSVDILDQIIG
jgi:hypothetical protein